MLQCSRPPPHELASFAPFPHREIGFVRAISADPAPRCVPCLRRHIRQRPTRIGFVRTKRGGKLGSFAQKHPSSYEIRRGRRAPGASSRAHPHSPDGSLPPPIAIRSGPTSGVELGSFARFPHRKLGSSAPFPLLLGNPRALGFLPLITEFSRSVLDRRRAHRDRRAARTDREVYDVSRALSLGRGHSLSNPGPP